MASLQWNRPSALTISYLSATGGEETITLTAGINFGVEDAEIPALRKHPIVAELIEDGSLDILKKAPAKTAELSGFQVTDNKLTGEPMPVQPVAKGVKAQATAAVTEAIAKAQEKATA
jgi:hypothetical protein